jgi:hypothetical protein
VSCIKSRDFKSRCEGILAGRAAGKAEVLSKVVVVFIHRGSFVSGPWQWRLKISRTEVMLRRLKWPLLEQFLRNSVSVD